MIASDFSTQMLSWISTYGPAAIAGLLFLAALGLPSPATLTVIFAGAMVRQDALDPSIAAIYGLAGTVSGDALAYTLARFAGGLRPAGKTQSTLQLKAQALVDRYGGVGIYITRWLITPPALAVTLLVGSKRYPFNRFLAYDLAGELTWIVVYGAVGYALGSQWEQASSLLTTWTASALAAAAAAAGLFFMIQHLRKRKLAWLAETIR